MIKQSHSDGIQAQARPDEPIQIVCAGDRAYGQHLGVMLYSLLNNSSQPNRIHITLLDGGVSDEDKGKLEQLVASHQAQLRFVPVDTHRFVDLKITGHISAATYYRLAIPECFAPSQTKVLYLDADLVVVDDIAKLWQTNIDGWHVAAADNPGFRDYARLLMPPQAGYFNAGVLLINLTLWRQDQIGPHVAEFVATHSDRIKSWDQDGLNAVLYGKWLRLHPKWNQQLVMLRIPSHRIKELSARELRDAKRNPSIIHFEGNSKPWRYMSLDPRRKYYYKYLRQTPWRDYRPPDRTVFNVLRRPYRLLKFHLIERPALARKHRARYNSQS